MSTEFIENPFVGPRTFSKQDRRFFFGREREARDLLALVLSERLVLFYAQSGAGKSSLINTRLLPRLVEEEGFVAFPVGRVSGQLPPDFKGDVANIFSFNLMLSLDSSDLPPEYFANLTLPEFFSRLTTADGQTYIYDPAAEPFETSAETDEPPHILIIDQFEEIINTNLDRWSERSEFFQQLEDAMAADQFLWVVLTLREDYLAALRPYERIMLNNMRGRYYMQRMGARAARQAIEQPAQLGGRPFAEGVAQSLVDNLRQIKTQAGDDAQLGQFIEPVQLQVVCYQLWQNLADRPLQPITFEDVAQLGDVNTALAQFYEQALEAVLQETAVSEINLRNWFDRELITEAETRGTVYQGDTETAGMPNELVRLLANRFLLRAEIRAGGAWYELVHDRFVEPILEANRAWREQQAPLVRAAIAWDEAGRPEELLIVGGPLRAAKQTVTAAQTEPLVTAFLAACDKADQALQEKEAQRQRELQLERERADEQARRVKTTRRMLALSLVLLVLAIGAAVFARRQQNIAIANEARAIAQTTLANAQSLQRGNQLQLSTLLAIVSLNNDGLAGAEEILRQNISRLPLVEAASQEWNDPLQDVVYSPNGEQIIIANRDQGLAIVYGTNDYQEIKRFRIPSAVVTALAIDPTSTILATNANSRRNNSYAALLFDIAAEGGVLSRNNVTETRAALEHQDAVLDMVFAADGSLIATASADQSACLWEVATGNKQQCFAVDDIVTTVLFSADNSQLLTGGRGGHLFDVATGEELMAFPHDSYLLSAAFSPDETQIATAGTDQMVKLWDANSGELLFSAAHGGWVNRVTFSTDGRWLATASNDGHIRLWDITNDFQEKQLNHEAAVKNIIFSPDGRWLASTSQDRTARLWDVATGQTLAVMGLDGAGAQLSFNQEGSKLVTTTESGPWQVWDLHSVDIPHQKFEHQQVVEAAVLTGDGALVFSGGRDFVTHMWERETGAETTLTDQTQLITDVAITAEDTLVATASEDGLVIIRDVSTQTVKQTIEVTGVVFALAFNQAGTRLTTVDSFGNVITWEIASGDELFRSNHSNFPDLLAVAYDPQGASFATGGADGSVVVWGAADGSTTATLTHGNQPITAISYTADGQWLLTASQDGLVRLWEVAQLGRFNFQNNPETQTLTHPDAVNDLAADRQGKWVATAGADGFLRLWELSTWAEVARVPHSGPVQSVAFSGNGAEIVTTSGAAALVWRVDDLPLLRSSDLVTAACQRVTRDLTDAERQTYIAAEGARNRVACP